MGVVWHVTGSTAQIVSPQVSVHESYVQSFETIEQSTVCPTPTFLSILSLGIRVSLLRSVGGLCNVRN